MSGTDPSGSELFLAEVARQVEVVHMAETDPLLQDAFSEMNLVNDTLALEQAEGKNVPFSRWVAGARYLDDIVAETHLGVEMVANGAWLVPIPGEGVHKVMLREQVVVFRGFQAVASAIEVEGDSPVVLLEEGKPQIYPIVSIVYEDLFPDTKVQIGLNPDEDYVGKLGGYDRQNS